MGGRPTEHLEESFHSSWNLIIQQNEGQKSQMDDVESADKIIRYIIFHIQVSEFHVFGQRISGGHAVERDVEAFEASRRANQISGVEEPDAGGQLVR